MTQKLTGKRCQCAACGQTFSTLSAFDKHRAGKPIDIPPDYGRRCLSADEMDDRGLKLSGGVWSIARSADYERFRRSVA